MLAQDSESDSDHLGRFKVFDKEWFGDGLEWKGMEWDAGKIYKDYKETRVIYSIRTIDEGK